MHARNKNHDKSLFRKGELNRMICEISLKTIHVNMKDMVCNI